jgi:serine/threonine-protein kinase HipA
MIMEFQQLCVYLHNHLVGHLWLGDKNRFEFQYDPQYLLVPDAMALSLSLPLREAPYTDDTARAFFGNLLPEGEVRSLIAKIKQVSEHNDYKMLEAIGGECAGAVTILPDGMAPSKEAGYTALSIQELEETIAAQSHRPLLILKDELRLSLAGAQNKIPLYLENEEFFLTTGAASSSHILKPQSAYFNDMVQNEQFCMLLANVIGLPVPDSFIWKGTKQLAYIVERYDRKRLEDGTAERIHQEDFCQVLGRMPEQKYENEGGPSLSECCRIIEKYSSSPVLDKEALVKWAVFNFLIGNADAHGKNLSLIREKDSSIRIAPFYDLISTCAYSELAKKMAMKIGRETRFKWIMERHWHQMADQLDIKFGYLKGVLLHTVETLDNAMKGVAETVEEKYDGKITIERICDVIDTHISHVRNYLNQSN